MSVMWIDPARLASSGTWTQVTEIALSSTAGWAAWTLRNVIASGSISQSGGSAARVTFRAVSGAVLAAAYIGLKSATGDAYDADSMTQLLFSGSGSVTHGAGETVVSDAVAFNVPAGRGVVVTAYYSSGNAYQNTTNGSETTTLLYYKSGNDAATANATGYTNSSSYAGAGVTKLELLI